MVHLAVWLLDSIRLLELVLTMLMSAKMWTMVLLPLKLSLIN